MKLAGKGKYVAVAFWDTSAIVPLCCLQKTSVRAKQLVQTHKQQVVWWGTSVEVTSALQRLIREENISIKDGTQFYRRLEYLRSCWSEIQPNEALKEQAERFCGPEVEAHFNAV